nr:ribonuclease H-like domain-containing protein [Tanacetum cinerariifolium]
MESQSETTQTVSALKLPVLKTKEYDLWSMRMEQYLTFTDHTLWEVIVNGHSVSPVASASAGAEGGYNWCFQAEEELTNFALMAYTSQGSSSSSSSDSENKVVYEEDIAFLKYDVQVKDISIKEIKNQLENALKGKDDLKLKLEKFETSSKNLTKLINSQISVIDKTGLGYDGQMNESDLNDIHVNKSEVLNNVFNSHESDRDDNQVNDRFKKCEGYHAVPPPYTGNYMPLRANLSFAGLNNYVFKYKVSKTITSVPKVETNASKTSKDSLKKPKTVRSSAPLIEEWKSDSKDENVFKPKEVKKIVKPSLEKIKLVNARDTTVENENKAKKPRKFSQSPRAASVSAARHVNTATSRPNVNNALPITYSYFKVHSPDQGIFNSGCSRHMTENKSYLTDYQEIDGGFVAFGENAK